MSLKLRLALLTATLLLGAVALFSAALLWSEGKALARDQARRRAETVKGLTEVCRDAVVGQKDLLLTNHLLRLGALPEILEASCVDEGGRVLGHTDMSRVQTLQTGVQGPPLSEDAVETEEPVKVGEQVRGRARIVFDGGLLRDQLESALAGARRRILRVSGLVILAGFIAAFLVSRWALASLNRLISGVRTIAGGKLDHRISEAGAEEVALLSREFNAMAGRLDELDKMKADFVNSVTHDLKSPLTAIKAGLDALQAGKPTPEDIASQHLLIRENAERLANLVTSILEVARIENGMVLDKRPVRLEDVAQRVVRTFRPLARPKGVALEVLVKEELTAFPGDESKLERMLANLVGNAVKFTARGSVTVEVGKEGEASVLKVVDTGPGIPAEALEKLFSKFFRVRRPGEKIEGTGLGLAIAKGIAEAHGGTVSVESRVGAGTSFTVRLPG